MPRISAALLVAGLFTACPVCVPAWADIALSANDGHTVLENGNELLGQPPVPDTLSVVDLAKVPPRISATIEVPASVAGPPFAVMVAPDESWAVVSSATRPDPKGPGGIGPDDRVSVIDLKASPPRIVQSLNAGAGASSLRLSPDGRLLLVANRAEGTVSVFTVKDRRLTAAGKLDLGNRNSNPAGLAFTRDGRHALLSRDGDNMVSVLDIDGDKVNVAARPLTTGLRPYALDINPAGTLVAVSNMGRGDGDIDSVSLIDVTRSPFQMVEVVGVPSGPEGLKFSPDGRFLAVAALDGTTKPAASPFFRNHGALVLFAVQGDTGHGIEANSRRMRRVAEAPIGRWAQGIAFSRDGRTILVQEMVEKQIRVFRWQDGRLTEGTPLPINGGPAAIRTSWP